MKRILSVLLCAVLCALCACPAFAGDEAAESGTMKIVNLNVDGLPIPAFATSENRDPLACSKKLPPVINAMGADIVAVQEDFNFHFIHKKEIDLPYKTLHSGPIPFGDGMNFFSRYPMYNVAREAWDETYGVLDSCGDELTPKGFMCASMEIADGVYVDVYDLHADADWGVEYERDLAARLSEYRQLLRFVDSYSKDHAVIIVGDVNARFLDTENEMQKLFIEDEGFKEIWIEQENEGRYYLTPEDEARFSAQFSDWWGYWDSAEKLFYRDGGGVSLEAVSNELRWLYDDETGERLADHAAQIAELRYTIDRSAVHDSRTYKTEKPDLHRYFILWPKYFFKSLFLLLGALPSFIWQKIKK